MAKNAFKRFVGLLLFFLVISLPFSSALTQTYNLTYDENGNLVQDGLHYFEYDGFQQLVTIRDHFSDGKVLEQYWYDADGQRIMKVQYLSDGSNETTYYAGKDFVRVVNSSGTYDSVYYYANDQLVAKNSSGEVTYYHPDHLGSTTLITDENGDEVSYIEYLPFGAEIGNNLTAEERGYTGQIRDNTELYYYGARYYEPELRRFTQPDPVIADVYNPQNLNRYAYVLNNPYKYTDPTGRKVSSYSETTVYEDDVQRSGDTFIVKQIATGVRFDYSIKGGESTTAYATTEAYDAMQSQANVQASTPFASMGSNMEQEYMVSYLEGASGRDYDPRGFVQKTLMSKGVQIGGTTLAGIGGLGFGAAGAAGYFARGNLAEEMAAGEQISNNQYTSKMVGSMAVSAFGGYILKYGATSIAGSPAISVAENLVVDSAASVGSSIVYNKIME